MRVSLDRFLAAGLVLAFAAGCSSGGDGGSEPGPTPAIAITLSPTSATVQQGGSTTTAATLTRSGGFSGTVNLVVQGAPTGVTGAASNVQTSGGVTTATVTIQVAAATAPGSYTLTVRGSGTGVSDATATFNLTVTAAGPAAAYTLAVAPAALSVARGASGTTQVALTRTAFTAAVNLTVTGAPTGVTTAFNPTAPTGATSTLTVTVGAAVPAGTYNLVVRGNATGLTERTAALTLTVTGGTSSGGNASLDFSMCGMDQRPIWFAYQDGTTGPWVAITSATHIYSFPISEDKAAFAYVIQQTGGSFQTIVYFMTRAEITTAANYCPNLPATKTVTGTAAGVGPQDFASISLGGGSATANLGATAFTINNVMDGAHDLIGWRYDLLGTSGSPSRGYVRRDVNVPNGGSVGTVDFGGSDSFAPATAALTVNGATAGEQIVHGMGYYTGATCSYSSLYTVLPGQTGGPYTMSGFPADKQRASDFHQTFVTAVDGTVGSRVIQEWFHTMGARTTTLPAALAAPVIVTAPGSYKRLQAAYQLPADYINGATNFTYFAGTGQQIVLLVASYGWVGSQNVTLVTPAFTGLTNWNDAWAPGTNSTGNWSTQVTTSNLTAATICSEGGRVIASARLGTY